ncbi:MAG: hypothetical protein Q4B72_15440, partial [Lachnospiraceae bacterium]|nr:hypothetical protein [Lachnospiraceae bacterium]
GTPWDDTENCKPVKFKVVVSSDVNKDKLAAERVEQLILDIGEVTLEKKNQIYYARSEFQALTGTQKELVDDDIYGILVAAELKLLQLERGDSEEDLGGDGDGGDSFDGDGSGDGTGIGGTGISDPSGGDGLGAGGETGVGNETSAAGAGLQDSSDMGMDHPKKSNLPTVVQAATTNKSTADSPGKKAGTKGKGKKFYEIDIQDIPKEVIEIADNISPETKIAVTACFILAFAYGFMRRRRQHIKEEKEETL